MSLTSTPTLSVSLNKLAVFLQHTGHKKRQAVQSMLATDFDLTKVFYWPLLRGLLTMHQKGNTVDMLRRELLARVSPKKHPLYTLYLDNYKTLLGRKKVSWFSPPATNWRYRELVLRIRPHLGLTINGRRHVVLLWMQKDPMTRDSRQFLLNCLWHFFPDELAAGTTFGIVELCTGKLHTKARPLPHLEVLLQAEAEYFLLLWNALGGSPTP